MSRDSLLIKKYKLLGTNYPATFKYTMKKICMTDICKCMLWKKNAKFFIWYIWHIMILPFSELSEIFGMEYAKLYKNKKTRFY